MLFVALGTPRTGGFAEGTKRRMEWQYPEGMRPIAEYWLQIPAPNVISVFEADSAGPIMAIIAAWDDLFAWTVTPAVTAEEGLNMAAKMMQG